MDLKIININGTDFIATESGAVFNENGVLTGLIGADILKSVGLKATENNLTDALQKQVSKRIEAQNEVHEGQNVDRNGGCALLCLGVVTTIAVGAAVCSYVYDEFQGAADMLEGVDMAEAEADAMEKQLAKMTQNMNKH